MKPGSCGNKALEHRELGGLEDCVHVVFLQFEGHAQFLQDDVVGHRQFDRLRWTALVLAALEDHQAIEEMRHDFVRAEHEAFFLVFLEIGQQVVLGDFHAAELDDLDHLVVADVEHVAHAAQYVVVNHGGQSWSFNCGHRPGRRYREIRRRKKS